MDRPDRSDANLRLKRNSLVAWALEVLDVLEVIGQQHAMPHQMSKGRTLGGSLLYQQSFIGILIGGTLSPTKDCNSNRGPYNPESELLV